MKGERSRARTMRDLETEDKERESRLEQLKGRLSSGDDGKVHSRYREGESR